MNKQYASGDEFWHNTHGRVMLIGPHPHDGALIICQRMQTVDADCDEHEYDGFETSELTALPDRKWPYLGFTRACQHEPDAVGNRCEKCGSSLYVATPK